MAWFSLIAAAALTLACAPKASISPYLTHEPLRRDTAKAQELTQEAVAILTQSPDEAERLLRQALAADLWHGPAHNNLGVIYLKQAKLFEAANEFEWARKLMPGHPDPRVNLALTMEEAGRVDEAISAYESALVVYPDYLPAIQGLVRAQVRYERQDDRTKQWLAEVALRGQSEAWREWARGQMSRRAGPE